MKHSHPVDEVGEELVHCSAPHREPPAHSPCSHEDQGLLAGDISMMEWSQGRIGTYEVMGRGGHDLDFGSFHLIGEEGRNNEHDPLNNDHDSLSKPAGARTCNPM